MKKKNVLLATVALLVLLLVMSFFVSCGTVREPLDDTAQTTASDDDSMAEGTEPEEDLTTEELTTEELTTEELPTEELTTEESTTEEMTTEKETLGDDWCGLDEILTEEPTTEEPTTEEVTTEEIPAGPKNVMIFGDSYSTFEGYIPSGYKTYYSTTDTRTNVRSVEETWWYMLCEERGYNLVRNDSWSGSTIGYTGYDGADTSGGSSFITRLEKLIRAGFFEENKIDTIFVFGGTNDSWANAPLGSFKLSDISKNDLYNVLPAIPYFLERLREAAPEAEIVVIINANLKGEIDDALKTSAEYFDMKCVELQRLSLSSSHPTKKGMQSIKSQIEAVLD